MDAISIARFGHNQFNAKELASKIIGPETFRVVVRQPTRTALDPNKTQRIQTDESDANPQYSASRGEILSSMAAPAMGHDEFEADSRNPPPS